MNMQALDTQLLLLVNHGTANGFFDVLMPALTQRGYFLVLPYLFYMLYEAKKRHGETPGPYGSIALWAVLISVCATLVAELLEAVLKITVARIRPCHVVQGIRLLTGCPESYSLPSGHAISSFAFATPLSYLTQKFISRTARFYPLVLASLIAYSRVYLGVHYPSDVLAGALLGAAIALLLSRAYERTALKRG